jgi:uncharacterized protein DUF4340
VRRDRDARGGAAAARVTVRGTLVLAAVFAVLATWVALTRDRVSGGPAAVPAGLLAAADRVTGVELEDGAPAARTTRRWGRPASDDLVAALATLRPLAIVDDAPADPRVYGLAADAPRLRALAGTQAALDLELGSPNPAGTAMYVRQHGQDRVLLVGGLLHWELEKLRRVPTTTAQP